ncbi:MAG: hypothetical protein E6J91_18690 [Deltaproteobacteria bacterium]|nr:MAG: hypothetical protein E6J91_18690 [Deltaproteobacteria bacterium]
MLANAVVSPHAPVPNLTVDISGPGIALDQQGQRIFFSALQNANVAQDDNAVSTEVSGDGKEKVVSIFVKFDRALSDPRIDGNSQSVFFRRDESFKFLVVQGAEAAAGAAVPPALRSDALLLADVVRSFGQAQIGGDAISTARRQDAFVLSGAPRSIRRGQTTEAISDLLGFYNAHVGGTADRHAAAAIDYAGGNTAWADGGQNPATTVEAQIDKIVADLAAEGGAAKIGAAATEGAPRALGGGSVKSQLDALLGFINGHITVAAGAHVSSAIAYAAGGAWKDGTANPATTVKAQLDKLVSDLVADAGANRIGVGTRTNWLDGSANPAGVSILAALSKIINDLSEHSDVADGAARIGARTSGTLPAGSVRSQLDALNASAVRTNAANVFSATQTVNGTADEKVPAVATNVAPTQPAQRKLLWESAGESYKYRLYAALFDFEITANARWDGAQWVRDVAAFASSKLDFNTNFFRLNSTDANNAPIGDNWPNNFTIEMIGHGHQVIDVGGNLISPGATETYISYLGPFNNAAVGTGAPFRKVFPAQPSSITFTMLNSRNVASGPFGFFPTPIGTAAFVGGTIGQPDVQFACHVLAT